MGKGGSILKLSREAYQAAASFVLEQARPLEQARLSYHLEGRAPEAVWQALQAFQNPDGGFAHGLDPNIQSSASSVLATRLALRIMRETSAPMSHPLLKATVHYLVACYDTETRRWPLLSSEALSAPRAPKWRRDANEMTRVFHHYTVTPRVELLGYLLDNAMLVPHAMMEELVPEVSAQIRSLPDALEAHDLLSYVCLAETRLLPHNIKEELLPKLRVILSRQVASTPQEWAQGRLQPIAVVSSPASPFAEEFSERVDLNLNVAMEQQASDGGWHPVDSWDDLYPNSWPQAQQDLAGQLTVERLILLHKFGRIEA